MAKHIDRLSVGFVLVLALHLLKRPNLVFLDDRSIIYIRGISTLLLITLALIFLLQINTNSLSDAESELTDGGGCGRL